MKTTFSLTSELQKSLSQFLHRRQAKDEAIKLLKKIKGEKNLKQSELHCATSLTIDKIVENIGVALSHGWMDPDELVEFLDENENAGRQHVLLYQLPESTFHKTLGALRTPSAIAEFPLRIEDYLSRPSQVSTRILANNSDEIAVKIVSLRSYWVYTKEIDNSEEKLIRGKVERERSAIIIKANQHNGLVQIRIPTKESGSSDTAKSVHEFLADTLKEAYPDEGRWIENVNPFPIGDTFNNIIENRNDFVMRHDTPENTSVASRLSKKGSMGDRADLRDTPEWNHGKGYYRTTIRGFWDLPDGESIIFMHINDDKIKLPSGGKCPLARLFVPRPCSDKELDHGISRILAHL